jgi:hypothetical protein
MKSQEQIDQWIAEFERDGERAVRDSINFRGGLAASGEQKLSTARKWLQDKERQREIDAAERKRSEKITLNYVRWTFWAAVAGAIFAAGAIIVTILHL